MREIQKELKWHKQEKRDHYLDMRFQFGLYTEGSNISTSQLYTHYCL
jgi:hypothetical protein